jgi:hypothetical protein
VTNLGTLVANTPQMVTTVPLAAGETARFIARSRTSETVRIDATPGAAADIRLERVDVNEVVTAVVNDAAVSGAETMRITLGSSPTWAAWRVTNLSGATTQVALTVTSTPPRPYVITTGALPFVDACANGGTTLGTAQDDQVFTAQTLPMAFSGFQLFGEPVPTTFRVSANGWLSWDTGTVSFGAFQNRAIPTATAPNGVLAPFWQDQEALTMCRRDDTAAGTVTYQWTGRVFQAMAQVTQFQVVLHANSVIDFIYGPQHVSTGGYVDADGSGATVGVENLNGTFGQQLVFSQPNIMPNTSRTLTPQ